MKSQDSEIYAQIREVIVAWPCIEDLLRFAIAMHGFGDSDGGFGVTYPGDLDAYQLDVEKIIIPAGMVQMYGYWGPPEGYEFMVDEAKYLRVLADVLLEKGLNDEAVRVKELATSRA